MIETEAPRWKDVQYSETSNHNYSFQKIENTPSISDFNNSFV